MFPVPPRAIATAIAAASIAVSIATVIAVMAIVSNPAAAQDGQALDLAYEAEHGAWTTRCDDSLSVLPPVCLAVASDADGQFAIGFGLTERQGDLVPAVRVRALAGGAPIGNRLLTLAVEGAEIARQDGRMLEFLSQLVIVYFPADADRLVTAARAAAQAAGSGGPGAMTVTISTTEPGANLAGQVALDGLDAALAALAAHHGLAPE